MSRSARPRIVRMGMVKTRLDAGLVRHAARASPQRVFSGASEQERKGSVRGESMTKTAEKVRIIGITGGTGAGKSEAARRFEELGFPVIDADRIGHELLEPGGEAVSAVLEAFGPEILTAGRIDRKKLGARVFADPEARQGLNAIAHPCIKHAIKRRVQALAAQGYRTVILDAALIAESGEREACLDGLILVTSPEALRIQRLMKSRGLTRKEAVARIRAQTPPEKKLALADWVLDNEGSVADLRRRVERLAMELKDSEG